MFSHCHECAESEKLNLKVFTKCKRNSEPEINPLKLRSIVSIYWKRNEKKLLSFRQFVKSIVFLGFHLIFCLPVKLMLLLHFLRHCSLNFISNTFWKMAHHWGYYTSSCRKFTLYFISLILEWVTFSGIFYYRHLQKTECRCKKTQLYKER